MAAALGAVIATAGPASSTPVTDLSYSKTGHSMGVFDANTNPETLRIIDRNSDGHSAVVLVRLDSTSTNSIQYWNYHGVGTEADAKMDMAEGRVLYMKACEGEWHGSVGASHVLTSTCDPTWRKATA